MLRVVHHRLLILTSFPFRVVQANKAYERFTGRKDILGNSYFDIFIQEGIVRPTIATCSTPLVERNQGSVVRLATNPSSEVDKFSKIWVFPVANATPAAAAGGRDGLLFYAVRLEPIGIPHSNKGTSLVYLPMPSGCMN